MIIATEICDVRPATPRTRLVRLRVSAQQLPFRAGQAVLVGAKGSAMRCPYSITTSPHETDQNGWIELLVGVNKDGLTGPHLTLERGAPVDCEGPIGTFSIAAASDVDGFVFIAGGSGIAPLRSMIRHALARTRMPIVLLYSARGPDEFAYADEFSALMRDGRIHFRQTVTRTGGDEWSGGRGHIGRELLAEIVDGPGMMCFVCGPSAFVDALSRLLRELGVPADHIRNGR